jgi:hypothetical protein
MSNKPRELKEILEQLWTDCNIIPDDGTIYDPIGILQDQALKSLFESIINGMPKEHKTETYKNIEFCEQCDDSKEACLYNSALSDIRKFLKEKFEQ